MLRSARYRACLNPGCTLQVTTQLLLDTQAGKNIKKLSKHPIPAVAQAANQLVDSWKETIKSEAAGAALTVKQLTRQSMHQLLWQVNLDLGLALVLVRLQATG